MLDAQAALGFVVSQSSHIEREVMAIPYPEIRYAEMVPVDTSAKPFAASVTFFTQDAVGRAKFMNGKGDDVPLANGIMRTKFEQGIFDAGIGCVFDHRNRASANDGHEPAKRRRGGCTLGL